VVLKEIKASAKLSQRHFDDKRKEKEFITAKGFKGKHITIVLYSAVTLSFGLAEEAV